MKSEQESVGNPLSCHLESEQNLSANMDETEDTLILLDYLVGL